MNIFNPDSWMDVVTILSVAVIVTLPTFLAARNHRSIKAETDIIKSQLVNGHRTMLREDLDRALAAIEALSHDVKALRSDLAMEEDRRRTQIDDLRGDVDRMRRR